MLEVYITIFAKIKRKSDIGKRNSYYVSLYSAASSNSASFLDFLLRYRAYVHLMIHLVLDSLRLIISDITNPFLLYSGLYQPALASLRFQQGASLCR